MSWAWFAGAAEAQQQAGVVADSQEEPLSAGAHDTSVTTVNSTFDSFNGAGVMTYYTPGIGRNAYCAMVPADVKAGQHAMAALATTTYMRAYMMFNDVFPAASCTLLSFRDTTAVRASLRLNTDGTLNVRDNVTSTGSDTTVLNPWTVYRFELTAVANGNMTVKVFSGTNLNTVADGTPDFSFTGSLGNFSWDLAQYGPTSTCAPISMWIADCGYSTAAMPVAQTYTYGAHLAASAV